jgi:hypothetical protein
VDITAGNTVSLIEPPGSLGSNVHTPGQSDVERPKNALGDADWQTVAERFSADSIKQTLRAEKAEAENECLKLPRDVEGDVEAAREWLTANGYVDLDYGTIKTAFPETVAEWLVDYADSVTTLLRQTVLNVQQQSDKLRAELEEGHEHYIEILAKYCAANERAEQLRERLHKQNASINLLLHICDDPGRDFKGSLFRLAEEQEQRADKAEAENERLQAQLAHRDDLALREQESYLRATAKLTKLLEVKAAQLARMREALQDVSSLVEFYAEKEMKAPANNQEAVMDTLDKLRKFRKALSSTTSSAEWLERKLAEAKQEALNDAAGEIEERTADWEEGSQIGEWLRARADALDPQAGEPKPPEG